MRPRQTILSRSTLGFRATPVVVAFRATPVVAAVRAASIAAVIAALLLGLLPPGPSPSQARNASSSGSSAQPDPAWRLLPNAPLRPPGGRHEDVFFIDDLRGWVVNLQGEVFRTTNGGISWETLLQATEAFRSVAFVNQDRGWLGSIFDINLLFETFDGGKTWSVVENISGPRPSGICGLWPVNEQVIYGCGKYSGGAHILKTADGGQSWTSLDLRSHASGLVDCYFFNELEGFVVGGFGTFPNQTRSVVLRTIDGGTTWEQRYLGPVVDEWCWKISFPTPQVGYVSIEGNSPHTFLKTEDGGLTWTRAGFANSREQGVGFVTEQLGWIGGDLNVVFYTSDGGDSWLSSTWGSMINRVFVIREDLAYAVGTGVYKYSREETPTGVVLPAAVTPIDLKQNVPNPFNPTTVIKYYIGEDSRVRLVVYNASGEQVRLLREEYLPEGDYEVIWDGKDDHGQGVASGLYFYRVDTGTFSEVKKMVLMK